MERLIIEGKTFSKVVRSHYDDAIYFIIDNHDWYVMYHEQDCCESVTLEDVNGFLEDLVNTPIITATEDSNQSEYGEYGASQTWTFYHFRTAKGDVTLRWHGVSNGYYSESVDLLHGSKLYSWRRDKHQSVVDAALEE